MLRRAGWDVVQLEAAPTPSGASVRNFGLIWVSGRAEGEELAAALRSRQIWEETAAHVPDMGFRALGSLTVAMTAGEQTVMERFASEPAAELRGTVWVDSDDVRRIDPAVTGRVLGALWCRQDAVVEPGKVLGALRAWLAVSGGYEYLADCRVVDLEPRRAVDMSGRRHAADLVVLACGAEWGGGALEELTRAAPLRRVRLQMLQVDPPSVAPVTAVADADSLRYYPAYESSELDLLGDQSPVARRYALQLLCAPRADGTLTVGDSHVYDEPFDFALAEDPYRELLGRLAAVFGAPRPSVIRRWDGTYMQCTHQELCFRSEALPGVWVVTGLGGRGMTCAPAVAEETVAQAGVA
jgi:FAD dependent oxidoreductase TIGR03364